MQTVEEYTGVRMDHMVIVDGDGFKRVTDALGGVDMAVDNTVTSIHKPYRTFKQGINHFNGTEALDYVRQRYQFAEGDFARIRHQQVFLKALLEKATLTGALTDVARFKESVLAIAGELFVDEKFSLVDLGWQFRNLRGDDLVFLLSPHKGTGTIEGESVVVPDNARAQILYKAMAADRMNTIVLNTIVG